MSERKRSDSAPPNPSEEDEQAVVVEWCEIAGLPIVHIPNEGKRSIVAGARLKRAGMQSGFPDLFIPKAANGYHGLFIEMKVGNNKPTKKQAEWLKLLADEGYATCVRYGADAAIRSIQNYIHGGKER